MVRHRSLPSAINDGLDRHHRPHSPCHCLLFNEVGISLAGDLHQPLHEVVPTSIFVLVRGTSRAAQNMNLRWLSWRNSNVSSFVVFQPLSQLLRSHLELIRPPPSARRPRSLEAHRLPRNNVEWSDFFKPHLSGKRRHLFATPRLGATTSSGSHRRRECVT